MTTEDVDQLDDVRWLEPDEREMWLRLLALISRLPATLDAQLQRDAGLTFFEYTVLAVLSEQPDRTMRMSSLAFLAQGSLSRLSHVAAKLEKRGFLRRETAAEDGRFTNAIVTDEGYACVADVAPLHVGTARHLVVDALTAQQVGQLRRISEQILSRIDPAGEWSRLA